MALFFIAKCERFQTLDLTIVQEQDELKNLAMREQYKVRHRKDRSD
jgi:hypothetical protein